MSRKIKSVSIPERLHERLNDIPNFSQWVIQALEGGEGRAGAAIDRAAANRRRHIRDLEDVVEDMRGIAMDLGNFSRLYSSGKPHHIPKAIRELKEAVEGVSELWEETLTIRRRQS